MEINDTPRVFVLEHVVNYDVSKASEFGTIVFMYARGERCNMWAKDFAELFLARLYRLQYDPNRDFICFTGPQMPMILCIAAVSSTFEKFRALIWNHSHYRERLVCKPCVKNFWI